MRTPSAPSRRPATSSIPPRPNACTTIFTPPAARATRKRRILPSAAASRSPTRCSGGAACWNNPRRPEVKTLVNRLVALLAFAAGVGFGAMPAQAHPHVWVTSSSELLYAADGSITGVRHAWTFDDMFTTYALQGIEAKPKAAYTRKKLAPRAKANVENLKEFGSFT